MNALYPVSLSGAASLPYKTLIDSTRLGYLPEAGLREAFTPFLRQVEAGEGEEILL